MAGTVSSVAFSDVTKVAVSCGCHDRLAAYDVHLHNMYTCVHTIAVLRTVVYLSIQFGQSNIHVDSAAWVVITCVVEISVDDQKAE